MDAKKALLIIFLGIVLLIVLSIMASSLISTHTVSFSFFQNNVAVVKIEGEITNEATVFSSSKTAFEIIEELDAAYKDPSVGAIVLYINSPGGSVVATRQIVEKIREIRLHDKNGEKVGKPVVAWIGDVGASGAYYIAAASNWIVADEDSITGSIGVVSIFFNFEGLMEKLGIKARVIKEGKYKDIGSPFRELSEDEQRMIQRILQNAFKKFKKDLVELRNGRLEKSVLDKVADGRILSGRQAKDLNLVDQLGTFEDALRKAASMAGIKYEGKPAIKSYEKRSWSIFEVVSNVGYSFARGFKEGLENHPVSVQAR
jgi:protease-4